nr:MAG TPA: hypothetical protein [Caudoviricetes sp.]
MICHDFKNRIRLSICRRMLSHRWYFADELQQQNLLKR